MKFEDFAAHKHMILANLEVSGVFRKNSNPKYLFAYLRGFQLAGPGTYGHSVRHLLGPL